jgi:hypothetical protein
MELQECAQNIKLTNQNQEKPKETKEKTPNQPIKIRFIRFHVVSRGPSGFSDPFSIVFASFSLSHFALVR